MASVNKVILVGNLGRDPEIRATQGGGKVATLSIATSERWKDRAGGETKERTEWHTVVLFGDGLVGTAERSLRKGSKVYVEGQQRTRKWQDQAGQDRWSTETVLSGFSAKLVLLDKRPDDPGRHDYSDYAHAPGPGGGEPERRSRDDLDDDVPF